ncbi:SPOR domain-containing protein [Thermophagus xiamenensis]|uniref:Sporulation related domain-containing protein n=1 Tax=Thermophagus xiamenensis TaxID=385682 RepID=A0A1I1X5R1_9BACT|nr:SPOR domain-containing protein [Thermophagus xiamenensis]SFE02551.1 Sporulation related domain-containing protein [Thermophagus xiamenensis]
MARIEKHILYLLTQHDCVIVPGLGGFVANYKPAVIIEERNLFQPPKKEIGFNRSLSHNDGLLANHICRIEKLSWDESNEQIKMFVENFQSKIKKGETIVFEGIGSFRTDALNNLQFTPNYRNQLLPDAYGLFEFHFEPIQNVAIRQKHEEPVKRLLRSRSPRYWSSVAAVIAGLFLFTPELKMPEQQINTGHIISAVTESHPNNESISEAIIEQPAGNLNDAQENFPDQAAMVPTNIETGTADKTFHLIVASFKDETPAQQSVKQLKTQGFSDASIILGENGRYRVTLEAYHNRDKALNRLLELRKKELFKSIWLLSQK